MIFCSELGYGVTSVFSECFFCGGLCNILLFYRFATIVLCFVVMLIFMSCSVKVTGFVLMFFVCQVLLNVVCFLRMGVFVYCHFV